MKRLVIFVLAGLMGAELAAAQRPGRQDDDFGGPPPGRGRMENPGKGPGAGAKGAWMRLIQDPAMAKEAGLTDEEVALLREAGFKHRMEMIDLEAQLEKARLKLQHLKTQPEVDSAKIEQAIEEVGRLETEVSKVRFRHWQNMKEIIGEERVQSIMNMRRERRQDGDRKEDRAGKRQGARKGPPQAIEE